MVDKRMFSKEFDRDRNYMQLHTSDKFCCPNEHKQSSRYLSSL